MPNTRILITVLFLLSGCSNTVKPFSDPNAGHGTGTLPDDLEADLKKFALSIDLTCSTAKGQPPCGLGGVMVAFRASASQLGYCTGMFISPTEVLTSPKCLIEGSRTAGISCTDEVWVVTPRDEAGTGASEHLECDRVSDVQPHSLVLKLKAPTARKIPKLNYSGLEDGHYVWVSSVIPSISQPRAEMRWTDCRIVQRSLVQPKFTQPYSSMGVITECPQRDSLPGSPVYDLNLGGLVGLVEAPALIDEDSLRSMEDIIHQKSIKPLNYVSNFACIQKLRPGERLPDECQIEVTESEIRAAQSSLDNHDEAYLDLKLDALFREWEAKNSQSERVNWRMARISHAEDSFAIPAPRCFVSPWRWLRGFHKIFSNSRFRDRGSVNFQVPSWSYNFTLTPDLVWEPNLKAHQEQNITMLFSPKQLAQTGQSQVELSFQDEDHGVLGTLKETLGTCK